MIIAAARERNGARIQGENQVSLLTLDTQQSDPGIRRFATSSISAAGKTGEAVHDLQLSYGLRRYFMFSKRCVEMLFAVRASLLLQSNMCDQGFPEEDSCRGAS